MAVQAFIGSRIFDGKVIRPAVLVTKGGVVHAITDRAPEEADIIDLGDGIIAPGFVDLQVNGGGGVMLNDDPSLATLSRMTEAHARLGTLALFPTLITDRPEVMRAAVAAVAEARRQGLPGVEGLHLEGPHLSLARKGAHDPALIRPMRPDDLEFLAAARAQVGRLIVTLAPESVDNAQISALAQAGVVVALGHTDCGVDRALAAARAGATLVTHLFNAMSQLQGREPGLVGAALTTPGLDAGLIADGVHVHSATMRAALAAKAGPGEIFLVTDAMAPAGTDMTAFRLNGRQIRRVGGRLTLEDGTLAGADLDFPRALRVLTQDVGIGVAQALAMATRIPARVGRLHETSGWLAPGRAANFVHLDDAMQLRGVWRQGRPLRGPPR